MSTMPQATDNVSLPPAPAPHVPSAPLPSILRRVDARGVCLVTLTVLAVLFAMQSAQAFIIPLIVSALLAYALDPAVSWLERRHIPRLVGSTVVLIGVLIAVVYCIYTLRGQAEAIINQLPEIAAKIAKSVSSMGHGEDSLIDKLQQAANVLEKSSMANSATGGARVVVAQAAPGKLSGLLLMGSVGALGFLGQMTMVTFLVYFLLLSGDKFRRKFIKIAGNTLSQKKISVHMLDEINRSIQRYMMMLLITNVALAFVTWIAFRWIGLSNAGTWALAAGAMHLVPYFGPLIIAVCTGVAAFMQFGEVGPALLTGGASLVIATLIGSVVTTWMTGRIAKMNAVAVFICLLLFTWVWGVWGMLLSIPIAVIVKVVADHIEGMQAFAEFLGE